MYKGLFFLHKSKEEQIEEHFREVTVKYLEEITEGAVKIGKVESNILLEQKFSLFCEVPAASKDEWDKRMNTPAGRKLNKDLHDYFQFITVIFINYEE